MYQSREDKKVRPESGYSLVEVLTVAALIIIIATMPVALLRKAREKTFEIEAIRSLNMMTLAYENYYAQYGSKYPNYHSDHLITDEIEYTNAEAIWDAMTAYSLIPRRYSGFPHNQPDLLAKGYVFSIFPADYDTDPGSGVRNKYAIGMIPYEGSPAMRGLAVIQGPRFYSYHPGPVPRKLVGSYSTPIYTLAD